MDSSINTEGVCSVSSSVEELSGIMSGCKIRSSSSNLSRGICSSRYFSSKSLHSSMLGKRKTDCGIKQRLSCQRALFLERSNSVSHSMDTINRSYFHKKFSKSSEKHLKRNCGESSRTKSSALVNKTSTFSNIYTSLFSMEEAV